MTWARNFKDFSILLHRKPYRLDLGYNETEGCTEKREQAYYVSLLSVRHYLSPWHTHIHTHLKNHVQSRGGTRRPKGTGYSSLGSCLAHNWILLIFIQMINSSQLKYIKNWVNFFPLYWYSPTIILNLSKCYQYTSSYFTIEFNWSILNCLNAPKLLSRISVGKKSSSRSHSIVYEFIKRLWCKFFQICIVVHYS